MRVSDGGRGGTKRYRGALDSHLSDIRKYKLLTPSGEFRLASATQRGEADARNELVQANLRLVVKIAKTYRVPGMDLDELIAEGELGLIEAANRFDPSRGVRFVAYAPYWIRKYVLLAVGRHKRHTTSPAEPDVMEGAERRAGDPRRRRVRRRLVSLDDFLDGSDDRRLEDSLASETAACPEDVALEKQLAQALRALLPKLAARDRTILAAHYGLDEEPAQSLQEIGKTLGLTRERVRQLEALALTRARTLLRRGRRR